MLECVINISEGINLAAVETIASSAADQLLDVHSDRYHNRSVLTLGGIDVQNAARRVAEATLSTLSLVSHSGVHPRIGVLDVVPFVPIGDSTLSDAVSARDSFAEWAGNNLHLQCFCYGTERSLPEVRKSAFMGLEPDFGPLHADPSIGGTAVGAREVLVAYNLFVHCGIDKARTLAKALRSATTRVLAFQIGDEVQLSANLISPLIYGPIDFADEVSTLVEIDRCELVGLVPKEVLLKTPVDRRRDLDLDINKTIEYRLLHGYSSQLNHP